MSKEIRTRVLVLLEQQSRQKPYTYLNDVDIAAALGVPVEEVRRQMDILESQGLTKAANTMGVTSAMISPAGSLAVENLIEAVSQPPRPSIGFKADDSR